MRRRRSAGIAAAALVALVLLYVAAWFVLAGRLERGIDRWAAERRADGWTVEYRGRSVSGFPFAWRARVTAPTLAQRKEEPAFVWSGPVLDLDWRPWRPKIVGFRSAGAHRVGFGPRSAAAPARLDMADAAGELDLAAGGRLQRLSLRISDATLTPAAGGALRLDRLAVTADMAPSSSAGAQAGGGRQPSLRLDGEVSGLILPEQSRPALGRTIRHIALRGAVMGRVPAANPRPALDAWRREGGTVEVERLELGWSALTVRARGTVALDDALQPIGAMTASIAGLSETADALVAAGALEPGQAMVAKLALGALARVPPEGGPPRIDVPLAAQEGWLFVGPIRIMPLPKVRWE